MTTLEWVRLARKLTNEIEPAVQGYTCQVDAPVCVGPAPADAQALLELSRAAFERACALMRPGATWGEVVEAAAPFGLAPVTGTNPRTGEEVVREASPTAPFTALAFKIAAAPFHLWAPDVYEGAPSPVSAYLSTASKAAGFLAIGRLLLLVLPGRSEVWVVFVGALAVLSMAFGNFVAIVQTNVKRLLAYSGIAQAGFLLIAVAAASGEGLSAVGLYLLLYVFANVGAFLCVYAVGEATDSHALENYDGQSNDFAG